MSVRPGMEYKPLPPIMPISACCKRVSLIGVIVDYSEKAFV
jgi:hypothetical protein